MFAVLGVSHDTQLGLGLLPRWLTNATVDVVGFFGADVSL